MMPLPRIKNLILLILALTAAFLMALVIPLRHQQYESDEQLRTELQTLFASYGVRLDAAILPNDAALYAIELGDLQQAADKAAGELLGKTVRIEQLSSRYPLLYTGAHGTCSFAQAGVFAAELTGTTAVRDISADSVRVLKKMGFEASEISEPVRVRAGVYEITATQELLDVPIFAGDLTFTYTNNTLTAISGLFFPGTQILNSSENSCISGADALARLLSSRDSLGWVGSRITEVKQGYRYTDTAAASTRLVPYWRIETDTDSFYVHGLTGEVSITAS